MRGFHNQVLHVDLKEEAWREEKIPDELFHRLLGGKGLASHLLLKNTKAGINPLSPENVLVFACGPATDTRIFGSSRYGVFTKSPLTGIYLESYAGGSVAEYLSRTGYDAILLEGKAEKPVYLEISPGKVQFHDARHIWGADTYCSEDMVREEIGRRDLGVAVIGPAGEKQVRFAVIENDRWRSLGRGGAGAVLGSKRVKALAFWGERKKEVARPDILDQLYRETALNGTKSTTAIAYRKLGTPMLVDLTNKLGAFPTEYWSRGYFAEWEKINANALLEQCEVVPHACPKCFLACGKLSQVKAGRHLGLRIEGPEYETINAFGGICLVDDIREILYLNDICDRLGLDTITAGNLAGFTIEASKRKNIGIKLEYGDVDGIARLLQQIAARAEVGGILADGIRFASSHWDLADLAVHIKGMEPPGYEPRVLKGMALAYATSDRGACHLRATIYKAEISGMIDPEDIAGKAKAFIDWEDRITIQDTLILCRFFRDFYLWPEYQTMILGLTGWEPSREALESIALNVLNEVRKFNQREGLSFEDDQLPPRLYREKLKDSGKGLEEADLKRMVLDYYVRRGWR